MAEGDVKPAGGERGGLREAAARSRQRHDRAMAGVDFDQAPYVVAWEVTRACAYACRHCRADAQRRRHPLELSTQEGFRLLERLRAFGRPIVVFTGGDPMMRPDLYDLIAYANHLGLRCSLTPTATGLPTTERLRRAQQAGVRRLALSLDAPTPEVHDAFRGVGGSWRRTVRILERARHLGLSTQVNTTVTRHNVDLLPAMVDFVAEAGAVQWSVFFLVPTGRASAADMVSPQEHERLFHWLYDLSRQVPFDIKATAAPMYRRVVIQRQRQEMGGKGPLRLAGAGFRFEDGLDRPAQAVNDGKGFLFISHLGAIMPSGFLPLAAGNVRRDDVVAVYRQHPLFRDLRDPARLKGKCGRCPYREVCGGQRGRAFALTGDYLASDPACVYEPPARRADQILP